MNVSTVLLQFTPLLLIVLLWGLGLFVLYQIIWRAVRRGILAARDDTDRH